MMKKYTLKVRFYFAKLYNDNYLINKYLNDPIKYSKFYLKTDVNNLRRIYRLSLNFQR